MGTEFQIVLYSADEASARRASDAAFARIAQLNAAFSDYDPESELMRLCERAGGPPVKVSDDLFRILTLAQHWSEVSEGAFDVTIGPVGRLWRRARRTHGMPEADALNRARQLVGYQKVVLDSEARMVRLLERGMKLDLGGIAKGFAAVEALGVLKSLGVTRALVAAAGDIAVGDPPPDRPAWSVEVQALKTASGAPGPSPTVSLVRSSISTSGDAEQFVEIGGVRYSHILDPHTGLGVVGRSSATVAAPDGTTAECLAKIVSILGPERAFPIVESTQGAAAFYARVADDGSIHSMGSKRWSEIPVRTP
jgi:thiamine biosynthesis lipoprotein